MVLCAQDPWRAFPDIQNAWCKILVKVKLSKIKLFSCRQCSNINLLLSDCILLPIHLTSVKPPSCSSAFKLWFGIWIVLKLGLEI